MKPSILFITTDEQHRTTVMQQNRPMPLPGINGLLSCSTVYENAYSVSPVCLPSRCSWMTGLYPHTSGCISNIMGATLPFKLPNLFSCLKEEGYKTSMHGKCHFIPVPYPATRGDITQEYEHFIHYYKSLGMDCLNLQDDKNNSLWYYDDYSKELENKGLLTKYREAFHGKYPDLELPEFPLESKYHPDSWVGDKTLEYLDGCNPTEPHFIWTSFSGPHYPMDAPKEYYDCVDMDKDFERIYKPGEWDDESKLHHNSYHGPGGTEGSGNAPGGAQKEFNDEYWKIWRKKYYANIVQIDSYIDKIISKANDIFGDNLLVIFTSDHGDLMGNHGLWGKNHSLHEDVLRVPLLVKYPNQCQKKTVTSQVSSLEVFPTILAEAGCRIPDLCDGVKLSDMVKQGGRKYIISECDNRVAVIKDGYKLCLNVYQPSNKLYKELYNLNIDPNEFNNEYNNPKYLTQRDELHQILADEGLLKTVFYDEKTRPYWLA